MSKSNPTPSPRQRAIHEQIDENLKRVYAATVDESIPDRFRDLLAQLKAQGSDKPRGAE